MSKVVFTRRELARANRIHYNTYSVCNNSIRDNISGETQGLILMLFYSVECGLKAVWMKRNNSDRTDRCSTVFDSFQHDLNKILDELRVTCSLRLPYGLITKSFPRNVPASKLNQALRYGSIIDNETDIEKKLLEILQWVKGELN